MRSIADAALAVLNASDPRSKTRITAHAARRWRQGGLEIRFDRQMPHRPARPNQPLLLSPNKMPKRGKGGSHIGRVALLHAIAHIELNAIDLAWDMLGRFGGAIDPAEASLFCADWIGVAADEARHFLLLARRLRQLGYHYGDFPAHDGLWEAAQKTAHDYLGRLVMVPLVLEARGLDVTPQTIERLRQGGDVPSAMLLEVIYRDEINHVRVGHQWFTKYCHASGLETDSAFESAVRRYLRGELKPPFNEKARFLAGLTPNLYQPLAK